MKKAYRIIEYKFYDGDIQFLVQKRSIFGYWYNPNNIDAYTTGWYDTFEEAEYAINKKLHKTNITVKKYVSE